jgi:hypothetical protein
MRGYPFVIFCTAAALLISPTGLTESQRVYLGAGKIKANRMSPAFSAIEDAFLLKDMIKESEAPQPKSFKKVRLKGLKVTSDSSSKVRNVALLGERIEVGHFTNKFITKLSTPTNAIERQADFSSKALSSAGVSPKITVRNLSQPILKDEFALEPSGPEEIALSQADGIERIELPSGVVLTRPIDLADENAGVNLPAQTVVSAATINYSPSAEVLTGKIEIDGGDVSFDRGDYVYYIERKLDGRVYEAGTLSAVDENFKIEVANRLGVLSVELRSLKGDVLAYGEKLLAPIDSGQDSSVTLFPSEDLFSGRILEADLSKDGVEIAASKASQKVSGVDGNLVTDNEGYFNESLFEKGSSFVVETKAKDRWSQVSIGISGKPHYSRLLKKKVFNVLSQTADPFGEEIEIQTVLMGEVTQLGLAQREVEVRIFDQEHQRPLYFTQESKIDHKLFKTSTGGKFAFINLPSGGYLIQAFRGETLLAQKWFIVKEGRVSKGQIELNSKTSVIASSEVFPPRAEAGQSITFEELGAKISFKLDQASESKVDLKSNPEVTVFESEPTEFFGRHTYVTASKLLKKRFKVVHKLWLEGFLNARRSNANRALGMVVGFIADEDFEVVKSTTTSLSSSSAVYYFDKNGDFTEEGMAGGGFVITDVKPGIQTTVVSMRRKEAFLNKVSIIKPYSVSIF